MSAVLQLALDATTFLADDPKPKGPEFGKATPLGLAVIVILLAVTFLLIRSMNKHVRNLPESFDDETPGQGDEAGGTDHAGTGREASDATVDLGDVDPPDAAGRRAHP